MEENHLDELFETEELKLLPGQTIESKTGLIFYRPDDKYNVVFRRSADIGTYGALPGIGNHVGLTHWDVYFIRDEKAVIIKIVPLKIKP